MEVWGRGVEGRERLRRTGWMMENNTCGTLLVFVYVCECVRACVRVHAGARTALGNDRF